MYKKHKLFVGILFCSVFFISCYADLPLNEVTVSGLLTAFSIMFGSCIAIIHVLYPSMYAKKLYKKIDLRNPGNTELHTLKTYFSITLKLLLISIAMLLFATQFNLYFNKVLTSFVLATSALNFYFSILLLKVFLDGLLIEGKT